MKFIFTILIALSFSFLVNSQIVFGEEDTNSNQLNKDSLENIENLKDDAKSAKTKRSEADIFGDEQTFPFVAGLGKNAAH
tara:strand:- start:819 stop:1058 length:240 start_codon:yes stop_codon:yes gene_type:complete